MVGFNGLLKDELRALGLGWRRQYTNLPQAICFLNEQPWRMGLFPLDRGVVGLPRAIEVCPGTAAIQVLALDLTGSFVLVSPRTSDNLVKFLGVFLVVGSSHASSYSL